LAARLEGLDHLDNTDRAELLVDYLGLAERQLVTGTAEMTADDKYELGALLLEPSAARFGRTEAIVRAQRVVYLKPMEKYQNTDK
jgi:hypothetical protein